jgi:hypothetical protein
VAGLGDGRGGWRGIDFAGYSIGAYVLLWVLLPILIVLCCCGAWVGVMNSSGPRPAPTIRTEEGK